MSTGYQQFTNEDCNVEGVHHDAPPPSYEQSGSKPAAPPCYHPDQTPCPMQKPNEQRPSPYPEQYPQQPAPGYGQQEPSQYPAQYPPQQEPGIPLTQPSGFPSQQPSQYPQPPVQQNIVHVTNQTMPNDYFCFALFVTLCCCLPFGIVAIIKSNEVKSRSATGDYYGAALASAEAKRYATIGLICGGLLIALNVVVGVVVLLSGASYSY